LVHPVWLLSRKVVTMLACSYWLDNFVQQCDGLVTLGDA